MVDRSWVASCKLCRPLGEDTVDCRCGRVKVSRSGPLFPSFSRHTHNRCLPTLRRRSRRRRSMAFDVTSIALR